MNRLGKHFASALALALIVAGFNTSVYAQDDVAAKTEELRTAWESAVSAYQAKNYSEAYTAFERAAQVGSELEDPKAQETAQRASQYLPRIAYAEGLQHLQNERYGDAIDAFDKGIERDSTYLNNLLGKGQAFNRMDREEDALSAYTRALAAAERAGDSESTRRAQEAIRSYYQPLASETLANAGDNAGRREAQRVISLMEEMQEHIDADANTYYYLAAAHNLMGEHQRAVDLLDRGLEMHTGSRSDKARFYFEKGEALRYMGDVAAAKEAYRNAAVGSYKQPAEHFIETL